MGRGSFCNGGLGHNLTSDAHCLWCKCADGGGGWKHGCCIACGFRLRIHHILIAGLILGGHHTMTELGITGMYFSKWQEAPGNKVPPPDAKKCNDPKDKANEAEDAASMAPSNGVEYTAYVKRFFALGSALFGAEFDTQVKSIADVYGTNWPKVEGAETPMLPAPETVDALKKECVGKTLCDLVGDLVPFWTEGQSPVGRSNSCTDKTSARSPNAKSATEMKATALQQSKQEQDPASLN